MAPHLSESRKTIIVFMLFLALSLVQASAETTSKVTVEFFYAEFDETCPTCPYVNVLPHMDMLQRIEREYGVDKVTVEWLDMRTRDYARAQFDHYGLTKIPAVVVNHEYKIEGDQVTEENLRYVIGEYIEGRKPGELAERVFNASDIFIVFSLGVVSGLSPCLMAMLAFLLTYTTGASINFRTGMTRALIFGVGLITAVWSFLSILLFARITLPEGVTWIFLVFLVLVGLNLVGLLKLPISTKPIIQRLARTFVLHLAGLFLLGFIFFFVNPCSLPLAYILSEFIHGWMLQDTLIMLAFSFGMLTLFLGVGIVGGGAPKLARKIREQYRLKIRVISGLILLGYSIWLILRLALLHGLL